MSNKDIIEKEFSYLNVKEVLDKKLVCKKYKTIASGDSLWKTMIERDFGIKRYKYSEEELYKEIYKFKKRIYFEVRVEKDIDDYFKGDNGEKIFKDYDLDMSRIAIKYAEEYYDTTDREILQLFIEMVVFSKNLEIFFPLFEQFKTYNNYVDYIIDITQEFGDEKYIGKLLFQSKLSINDVKIILKEIEENKCVSKRDKWYKSWVKVLKEFISKETGKK